MLFRPVLSLLLVFCLAGPARAHDHDHGHDHEHDQDRARAAMEAGRVVPLQDILDKVEQDFTGRMIQVELEDNGHRIFYEVKLLTDGGRLLKLRYDAASMELLNADSPDIAAARRESHAPAGR
jgi:uncharacterized membrane protein YkoI